MRSEMSEHSWATLPQNLTKGKITDSVTKERKSDFMVEKHG